MTEVLAQVAELVRRESGIRVRANQHHLLGAALARIELAPEELLRAAADPLRRSDVVVRLLDEVAIQ